MKTRRSIRFELTRLAAVVALPLLGVIAYLLVEGARRDLNLASEDARRLADLTAARTERFLGDFRATLEAMARRPLVRAMDPENCDPALPTLHELYPRAGNVLIADAQGWILCGAKAAPGGQRLQILDLQLHQAVMSAGQFRLSRPLVGLISKTWVVTAVQPVRGDDGRIVGAVGMAIDLLMLQAPEGPNSEYRGPVAGIVAHPGIVIAHSQAPLSWIGRDVSQHPQTATLLRPTEGTWRGSAFDVRDHLWATRPITGTHWIAYAGVDAESALAPARRRALWALLLVLTIVGATIAAAIYTTRRIVRPVRAIAEVARARAAGAVDARAVLGGPQEVVDVAAAFNAMIEVRLKIAREREAARADLELNVSRLSLLHQITRAIGQRQDLSSIFQVVLGRLEGDLPIDFGGLGLYDAADQTLLVTNVGARGSELIAASSLADERLRMEEIGLPRCLKGELVYATDIAGSRPTLLERLARAGLRALVAAPLVSDCGVFAVLLAARRTPDSFTSDECEFLRQLCEHVSLAARQAQLHAALQQAYDDLRASQQALMQQERLRALGQMASGIAHDINNAITPVTLYTDALLERERSLSPQAREQLATIQRAIGDVASTVARMREFYRPREAQMNLQRMDVNRVLEQVLELTRPRWYDLPQVRGIRLELLRELSAAPSEIMGAEAEIRDALTNLIFNAVDAMPSGGVLTLRTRSVRASPGDDLAPRFVQVEVTDSGVGMDEETRRRCLEPFFTTKGERGTGLGLAMVYGMVQRHSAEIEIDSTPGSGTTVRLIFPAHTQALTTMMRFGAAPRVIRHLRILLIDDDPLLIRSLADILRTEGHSVTDVDGGQAGIDAFIRAVRSEAAFDLVVTDLGMPHVDGRQVAAAVKGASAATPVILLTGWGQRFVDEQERPAHVDRILGKPPRLHELRAALEEVMG